MNRALIVLALSAALVAGGTTQVVAQDPIPDSLRARVLPRQYLSGPRFGFTTFTGDVADQRRYIGKSALMSQFGWQFETQLVSTRSGNRALMEWVVLVGGVEQDELNLSLSWLAGYRLPNGVEFGVGPNVSVRKEGGDPTISMVIAGGATLPFGELYVPLNLALAFAEGGPRITTLIGWIIG
jgi:hypothetical protein